MARLPISPFGPGLGGGEGLHEALGQALVEMVQMFRAGNVARALELRNRIQAELGGLIAATYRGAVAHAEAGRAFEAFYGFVQAVEQHRTNLANIEMPVSLAACFEGLRGLFQAWDQPVAAAAAARLAAQAGQSFYPQPRACQIPVLGGLYEEIFGEMRDGCFVEVGAFDGDTYSNTSCLADLGWRGVYIEPVPAACAACRQRHAGNAAVTVVECAIGAADGTVTLWQNGPCTTASDEDHAANLANGWQIEADIQRIDVPQRRLDRVLTETGIAAGFDLLVVDVEGFEEAVFAGFDLDAWRPRFMLIELIEDNPRYVGHGGLVAAAHRIAGRIVEQGYEAIYRDFTNTMFRRRA